MNHKRSIYSNTGILLYNKNNIIYVIKIIHILTSRMVMLMVSVYLVVLNMIPAMRRQGLKKRYCMIHV